MTSFADMEGIARVEENALALEFQVKDNIFGIIKSQPREVRIPFAELAEVTFRRGWFRGVLIVRARRMSVLADVPGTEGAEIRLRCQRRYRDAAQELASQVSMRMVEDTSHVVYPLSNPPPPVPHDASRQPPPPRKTGGLLQ